MIRFSACSVALAALLLVVGCECGKNPGPVTPPCDDGTDSCNQRCLAETASDGSVGADSCGEICGPTLPCPDTYYCGEGDVCYSDCASDGDEYCPSGTCSVDGRCDIENLLVPDAGTDEDGGPNDCARSPITETVTPNVIFVIDQSTSMADDDISPTRWDAARNVLIGADPGMGDTGLIGGLEAVVRFGVYLYSQDDFVGTCPTLTSMPDLNMDGLSDPLLNNYAAIEADYRTAGMIEDTPTGDSIHAILDQIEGTALVTGSDPTILVLATDGAPDTCHCPDNGDDPPGCDDSIFPQPNMGEDEADFARRLSVESVQRAQSLGVDTFVLAVANNIPQDHVDDLANAGVGNAVDTVPAADSWRVNSASELSDALLGIVSGQLSCTIDLQGIITDPSDGCAAGTVTLVDDQLNPTASQPLTCNAACVGDPGSCTGYEWALVNDQQLQLYGAACDDLLDGASPLKAVDASFPCSQIIIP